jgi:hypothetical protein
MIVDGKHIYGVSTSVIEIPMEDSTDMAYLITIYDGNQTIQIQIINGQICSCEYKQQRRL